MRNVVLVDRRRFHYARTETEAIVLEAEIRNHFLLARVERVDPSVVFGRRSHILETTYTDAARIWRELDEPLDLLQLDLLERGS